MLLMSRKLVQGMCGRALWVAAIVVPMAGCAAKQRETVITVPVRVTHSERPPTAAQEKSAQLATADEMYTVYSQNLIQGANPNQRFLFQLLHVSGVFVGVSQTAPGHTYLELQTHDPGAFAYAELALDAEGTLSSFVAGRPVELYCRGNGSIAGSPLLRDCRKA